MPLTSSFRQELFPAIEPHATGMLDLDGAHSMYWEESGNPQGTPILFLHGGPGAGCSPDHRRFFDPTHYRIVLFDQRGAGRSTPSSATSNNSTEHLIADIERLREHLRIDRWYLFGGSWGSTLALAYGQLHTVCCLGFVLRGIFLGRQREIDWFLYGVRTIFPEAWRAFAGHIPPAERNDLLTAYHRRLRNPDALVHLPAARVWSAYESACSTLRPSSESIRQFTSDQVVLNLARIEAHFFVNDRFLRQHDLLGGVTRLRHLPCIIVQGRYDIICPITTADELARAWPEASYCVVPDAGHSAWEPGILAGLLEATEKLKHLERSQPSATIGAR
jgi:proline iminopeptidase